MKIFKRSLLLLATIIIIIVVYNYPKLNIVAGYSAKSMSSSVFLAKRSAQFTDSTDNNFSPINFGTDKVDKTTKTATSSVFGLLSRKAVYREGVGSVLVDDDFDTSLPVQTPKRAKLNTSSPYPFGNAEQKDTVLSSVDYSKLNTAISNSFADHLKTRAVVVIHKNQIIAERYGKEFNKNSRMLGWSMTKSIMSTVFGILQHQEKIDIYEKAPVKEWQNDSRKNITINDLLHMNSGLEWDENYDDISDVTKMLFLERNMSIAQAKKQFAGPTNETWNYSSGTSNLLSGILRTQFTEYQEYLDFWYTNFIDKIGMNSMVVETDMDGNYVGSSYSWATPRDWAKFGLLYLNNGNWNGTELFTKDWVDYITTPTKGSNGTYGGHFWLNAEGQFPDLPKNMYFANGYQGQMVCVFPDQDLVVVRMALADISHNDFLKGILESIQYK